MTKKEKKRKFFLIFCCFFFLNLCREFQRFLKEEAKKADAINLQKQRKKQTLQEREKKLMPRPLHGTDVFGETTERERAEAIKEAKKTTYMARLNNCPTSPRKMRLMADLVRGEKIDKALNILKFSSKESSRKLEKLLLSAINNWQQKNEDASLEDADLFVKEIRVDGGTMLKRLRPAPQGRAHRIRKRSNHVTLVLAANDNTQSK